MPYNMYRYTLSSDWMGIRTPSFDLHLSFIVTTPISCIRSLLFQAIALMPNGNNSQLLAAELLLVVMVIGVLLETIDCAIFNVESLLQTHIAEQRRLNQSLPIHKIRPTFEMFKSTISSSHFKRMFRMSHELFDKLCTMICNKVGVREFRPEYYLAARRKQIYGNAEPREQAKPPVSGEIKVAISIRLLAGGSYLDLMPLFRVASSELYDIFETFLDWILRTLEFPLLKYLKERNWAAIRALASAFAEKTNGVFYGPFAAIDGLAVRIRSPTLKEVPDPGNYYCRKGFFALNAQAMCDKSKYFLWCFPSNKGSTHDSAAFTSSSMYELLVSLREELRQLGLFVVGDSAYSLMSFLMTPYEKEEMKEDALNLKDAFNFYLSSCRIYIECAFGELVMRWGILWRMLDFPLRKCIDIIQVCMLLHNFILEFQEDSDRYDMSFVRDFDIEMDDLQRKITKATGEMPAALVTDNNEVKRGGRPRNEEVEERMIAENIRMTLILRLAENNMKRPSYTGMSANRHGHVYLTNGY